MQKSLLLLLCFLSWPLVNIEADCSGGGCRPPRWKNGRTRGHGARGPSYVTLRAAQGTPVYLRCRAQGSPRPRIQWLKNGIPLSQRRHGPNMVFHKRTLKLTRVKKRDSGNYTCVASNEYGTITRHFSLTVIGPPAKQRLVLLHGHPRNVSTFVGHPATLTCRVLTNVPFTARWLRYIDDIATLVETDENIRQVRDSLEDFSDESSMEDSSPEEDYSDESDLQKWPRDLRSRSWEAAEAGGDIQQRLWERRHGLSMEFDLSSSESSLEDENDIRLVIQNAKETDSGRYSCLVMSEHARIEKSAWLTVHPVDKVEMAYAERRELWRKRWGGNQGPEEYLRGIVIAVSVSSVLLIVSIIVLFVMAIMKAYRRQDVVLHIYDLRGRQDA